MNVVIDPSSTSRPLPLVPVTAAQLEGFLATQPSSARRWVESTGFKAQPASWCGVAGLDGSLSMVLVGVAATPDVYALSHLPYALPEGDYALAMGPANLDPLHAALGFALGAYQFTKYRKQRRAPARLVLPQGANPVVLRELIEATKLVRDLVNTPTEDMGPEQLSAAARELAQQYGADFSEVVGDELLIRNFPSIHAVGRASHRAPRLLEIVWGQPSHPRVALLGKGVCFDTGGLDIKPADGMRWMKKDMGGAAHALG
ncbi:MAG TPA: leucyl aminopeptidase family protein, partial [Xanthomonadales bacterium]|nr:leucyl aminopeptidase family protein [Xanthomonadales bacterium]